jgi:hypothetical protein
MKIPPEFERSPFHKFAILLVFYLTSTILKVVLILGPLGVLLTLVWAGYSPFKIGLFSLLVDLTILLNLAGLIDLFSLESLVYFRSRGKERHSEKVQVYLDELEEARPNLYRASLLGLFFFTLLCLYAWGYAFLAYLL